MRLTAAMVNVVFAEILIILSVTDPFKLIGRPQGSQMASFWDMMSYANHGPRALRPRKLTAVSSARQ